MRSLSERGLIAVSGYQLRVLDPEDLPTARGVLGHDDVSIGRLRVREDAPGLSFVLALNSLRSGAALSAVDVAELLLG